MIHRRIIDVKAINFSSNQFQRKLNNYVSQTL